MSAGEDKEDEVGIGDGDCARGALDKEVEEN